MSNKIARNTFVRQFGKARICVSLISIFLLLSSTAFAANTLSATTNNSTTTTTVTGYGTVTATNNATLTDVGICYATTTTPTTAGTKISAGAGTLNVQFSGAISGLTAGQRYYLRDYCTNGTPTTFYGTQVIVYTLHTITTGSASSIALNSVIMDGNITSTIGANANPTARGFVYSTSANPTLANSTTTGGTATGSFSHTLSGLIGSTTYHVRAYVTNAGGTSYGSDVTFTTASPPTVTYANLPLTETFTGSLSANWATSTTNAAGVIAPMDLSGAWPQFSTTTDASSTSTGGNGLAIYNTADLGSDDLLSAALGINALNETGVTITFPIVDWGTGYSGSLDQLNVYLSVDGGNSYGATPLNVPLNLAPYFDGIWNNISLDISALATSNSLTLSSTTVVKMVFNLAGSGNTASPKSGNQFIYLDNMKATYTGTLPVELLYFKGQKEKEGNLLSWSTASEINNDHFELERSYNGSSFETIDFVEGKGTYSGISHYAVYDNTFEKGIVYYRLKQVDFDGKTTYSKVISLQDKQNINVTRFSENSLNVSGENLLSMEIYDLNGKLIASHLLNKQVLAQTILLDYSILSNSVYLVRVIGEGQQLFTQKMLF
jgi:hypothetical protein